LINMLKVAKIIFAILYTISICQRNKSCYFWSNSANVTTFVGMMSIY
jgi:hypothetical protein